MVELIRFFVASGGRTYTREGISSLIRFFRGHVAMLAINRLNEETKKLSDSTASVLWEQVRG